LTSPNQNIGGVSPAFPAGLTPVMETFTLRARRRVCQWCECTPENEDHIMALTGTQWWHFLKQNNTITIQTAFCVKIIVIILFIIIIFIYFYYATKAAQ